MEDRRGFDAKPVLDQLCEICGCVDFGYRMQAIFAHVLLRLGARIIEINAHGHPDIRAEFQRRQLHVQVKALLHSRLTSNLTLTREDLAGIESNADGDGYLAVLDCALPVNWIVIPAAKARLLVDRPAVIATLQAERTESLSLECTDVFLDLILEERNRLERLSFAIAAQRALRGEQL